MRASEAVQFPGWRQSRCYPFPHPGAFMRTLPSLGFASETWESLDWLQIPLLSVLTLFAHFQYISLLSP